MVQTLQTPYYLIDETRLQNNLDLIQRLRQRSGAKVLLALKCFATWSVFAQMRPYLDGTTSSSLYEVKLGHLKFGGETHAYSVAWRDEDIAPVLAHADKIIFNSIGQLQRHLQTSEGHARGLRLNPQCSNSPYLLADPARPHSRLGETDVGRIQSVLKHISGFMIHNNCENRDFAVFDAMLGEIEARFGSLLHRVAWVSLGGGIHFTAPDYPIDAFATRLRQFADTYGVQVYLEPGEAAISNSATLEVTVLDTLHRDGKHIAIVDSSIEAHMLDLLIYRQPARVESDQGEHPWLICGNSCLAGDIFGEFRFAQALKPGDRLSIQDAAGYTMVKKNWFNGVRMPAIVIRRKHGSVDVVKRFTFEDYVQSLS